MSIFLDVVQAFKFNVPQISGTAAAVMDTSTAQALTSTSDKHQLKAARVSPVALSSLSETDLDKQIEEKLKGDEPLLKRVRAIFTSLDDKKNFLSNLDEAEKLHRDGNIEFYDIRDPSSILRRLAFQFTFIGFSSTIDSAFKLRCIGYSQEMSPEVTNGGACNRVSYLNYWISILDNDENRFLLNGPKPIFPREIVEDAEIAHAVQRYLKDLLGVKEENLIAPDQFVMFIEIPEHLKILFYKSLQDSEFDMSQGLSLGTGVGFFMEGHLNAKPVSDRLITKLLDWEKRNLIKREDLPQCIRAYTVIFSLVNPKEICIEGNKEIRQLIRDLGSLLIAEIEEHKESKIQDVENILTNHSDIFKARGLKESDFELIRTTSAILAKCSDMQEKAAEWNKLAPILRTFFEEQKQFTDRTVSSILSIDDPKTLFAVATNTIENGGYVPLKD